MWNVSNRFKAWLSEHYKATPKPEMSAALSKLVDEINAEIQKSS
jgi:hypothetical protein